MNTGSRAPGQGGIPDNLRGAGLMIFAMACFTTGDACMKAASELMPIYQAVVLRGLLTIPLLVGIAQLTGGLRFDLIYRARGLLALRTVAEVLSTVTFFVALVALPLPVVTAILQATPLVMTAVAALFLREKVGLMRTAAICAGFLGVLLIVRPGAEGMNSAVIFVLVSVLFVVLRDLSTRQMPRELPSVSVAVFAATGVTVVSAVLSLREPWVAVPQAAWPMILGGVCCIIGGYISVVQAMRVGEVSYTISFRYTALVWALLLGWLVNGYFPDGLTLLGGAIVVASGLFTILREARLRRLGRLPH